MIAVSGSVPLRRSCEQRLCGLRPHLRPTGGRLPHRPGCRDSSRCSRGCGTDGSSGGASYTDCPQRGYTVRLPHHGRQLQPPSRRPPGETALRLRPHPVRPQLRLRARRLRIPHRAQEVKQSRQATP
ncbi:uncharacterized protein LOC142761691 isoform X1 [Rhipicephalus microplus]|uniref:uncharacterized protein LOC142761691 isoform X1 n=1 Tax=Rhipicephalus microplus TaxID=6941 RepID=UPI003F6C920D